MSWKQGQAVQQEPERPVEKETSGYAAVLRERFRIVARNLTRRYPQLKRKSRRRREEAGKGLRAFAKTLFCRMSHTPVFDPLDPGWDAFTWLHLFQYNDATGVNHSNYAAEVSPPTAFLHL